jgi:hypothetical protein
MLSPADSKVLSEILMFLDKVPKKQGQNLPSASLYIR